MLIPIIESPFTNGKATLKREKRTLEFRKEPIEIIYHFYQCDTSGEKFTTTAIDEINQMQVYNIYRVNHNLPFPEEIKTIRNFYEVSASKMSEILGFGINVYRNYENGEVPNDSNGRLIQLIKEPDEFKKLIKLSNLNKKEVEKIYKIIDEKISTEDSVIAAFENYILGQRKPSEYNGYRIPNLSKCLNMIAYFAKETKPFKVKLNKLLFYADFLCFKTTCYSISGSSYRAIPLVPSPSRYDSLFEFAVENDFVRVNYHPFDDGIGEEYIASPVKPFNEKLFSEIELEILKAVKEKFKSTSTNKIRDLSHEEEAWIKNKDNRSEISYSYGFNLKNL